MLHDWKRLAAAAGWPEERIETFARGVYAQNAFVLYVDENIMVLRTDTGARQSMRRSHEARVIARGTAATQHIAEYLPPEGFNDGWCAIRDCKARALQGLPYCGAHIGSVR